jgi:hypothetical protein
MITATRSLQKIKTPQHTAGLGVQAEPMCRLPGNLDVCSLQSFGTFLNLKLHRLTFI